ncbi:Zuotin [Sorochytrium milnesiophthora]
MVAKLNIQLPEADASAAETTVYASISDLYDLPIDVISPRFFVRAQMEDDEPVRRLFGLSADGNGEQAEEVIEETPEEIAYLHTLDPKDWKKQDHYIVLGLSSLRYKATDEDIKTAYRKKVLIHHPDKKATTSSQSGKALGIGKKTAYDDSIFKCIQKAWDQLSDPVKRRQYDSVDYGMDDDEPTESEMKKMSEPEFYKTMGAIFEREGRFSKNPRVPKIGDENSDRNSVMGFYDFFYNMDSWRSFEYEDKEGAEGSENRDDKRYMDKKNKAERAKKKKEDNTRLRELIDLTLKYDPRIARFKKSEKSDKDKKKKQRDVVQQAAEQQSKEDEVKAQQEKEKAEEEAKQKAQAEREARAAQTKAFKKEKKTIKQIITKDFCYLTGVNATAPSDVMERVLADLEKLFEFYTQLSELEEIRRKLEAAAQTGEDDDDKLHHVTDVFQYELTKGRSGAEAADLQRQRSAAQRAAEQQAKQAKRAWTTKETQVLIKAVNMFPGGTVERWEKIATYVHDHSGEPLRKPDEVIAKSKEVEKGVAAMDPTAVKEMQGHHKKHQDTSISAEISTRDEYEFASDAPAAKTPASAAAAAPWSSAQQEQLQNALKLYPPSYKEADRWERIAELVEGKSEKDCKLRVKHLAEQVQAKKAQTK